MDTQLATSQIRLQNWVAIIRDQKSSGLTIKDYCQEHDLSQNAYYYWLRKSRRAALQATDISFRSDESPNKVFRIQQEDSKNRRRPAGHSCVMFRDKRPAPH